MKEAMQNLVCVCMHACMCVLCVHACVCCVCVLLYVCICMRIYACACACVSIDYVCSVYCISWSLGCTNSGICISIRPIPAFLVVSESVKCYTSTNSVVIQMKTQVIT